ncbi:PREDICTED: synaptotagmin-4-like isoform X2 [Priapulus caudatus]|uniref:Synaptotagmin-4-like isoform X2 n=1 Tax=Priapulus caudatus TaxID=37621 RepID=A0ABM1EF63_PRICU|nr:PREDICTED: synaptotagmin-4-like isoform X2 [Priapulus caudatus]
MAKLDETSASREGKLSTPALVGIAIGSSVLLAVMVAMMYVCYRRRYNGTKLSSAIKKTLREPAPGSLMASPTGIKTIHVVTKKSPSPTQPQKEFPQLEISRKFSGTSKSPSPGDVGAKSLSPNFHVENEERVCSKLSPSSDGSIKESDETRVTLTNKDGKLGDLHFMLRYNFEKGAFLVTVLRAVDLPAKDTNTGSSDPYVKLQLLPEKQHKVKTRVLRKTTNPVYNEEFTFYGLTYNQLQTITLHFVILSFDRYSRDDIIGEVQFPLKDVDLKESEMTVHREITPRNLKIRCQSRGELLVSLCYQPAANRLTVVVLKARNLPKMDMAGLCDPYVKIYLLYNGQRIAKKKTHVKKRTLNPVFNESFLFDVPNEGLENLSLEMLVLDWDRVTTNEVIGRLEVGAKSTGNALRHWNEVCNSPRRQIAEWHRLKD